jgi:hypothetical protein
VPTAGRVAAILGDEGDRMKAGSCRRATIGEVPGTGGKVVNMRGVGDAYVDIFLPTDQAGRVVTGAAAVAVSVGLDIGSTAMKNRRPYRDRDGDVLFPRNGTPDLRDKRACPCGTHDAFNVGQRHGLIIGGGCRTAREEPRRAHGCGIARRSREGSKGQYVSTTTTLSR